MGEKMTLAGELKRKVYDEYLSLYDGDKDKALQDLGTFYLGWLAIEKDITQPAQAVDVDAIEAVIRSMAQFATPGGLYDYWSRRLTAALPKDSNGAEGV